MRVILFFKGKKHYVVPAIIYCFATYAYFIINYYTNAGIYGPTIFGFIATFILIIALGPMSWHRLWVVLHIIVVVGLLALEYFNIGRYNKHSTRKEHFSDIGVYYIICLAIMYLVIIYIRNNYLREKRLAQQFAESIVKKNEELDELNQLKNRLFSIISHDLYPPLNSVQRGLELLLGDVVPENEAIKGEFENFETVRLPRAAILRSCMGRSCFSKTRLGISTTNVQKNNCMNT